MNTLPTTSRLDYMDLTKGVLVLLMVVYHSLNYSSEYYLAFRYFSFLPPSFIFISGLLIFEIYPEKYRNRRIEIYRRLWVRGGKLFALFVVLNIFAGPFTGKLQITSENLTLSNVSSAFFSLFVFGTGRSAVFEILLPIAYLLILSPLLLHACSRRPWLIYGMSISVFVICLWLNGTRWSSETLNLVSAGMLGLAMGSLHLASLAFLKSKHVLFLSIAAFVSYYPFSIHYGYSYSIQIVGAAVSVIMLLSVSVKIGNGFLWRGLMLLGKYSLLAYIIQIVILQLIMRLAGRPAPGSSPFWMELFGTLALMTLTIIGIDWLRERSRLADSAYKWTLA